VDLSDAPLIRGHRPSIEALFRFAAQVYEASAVGILITGMGRDGLEGYEPILGSAARSRSPRSSTA